MLMVLFNITFSTSVIICAEIPCYVILKMFRRAIVKQTYDVRESSAIAEDIHCNYQ